MSEISNRKKDIADTEIGNVGVVRSSKEQGSANEGVPSNAELSLAIGRANKLIAKLMEENEQLKVSIKAYDSNSQNTAFENLAKVLDKALNQPKVEMPKDDLNRATDYTTTLTVDGRSLMEAQQSLLTFKREARKPISIPKSFADSFGPTLAITVNGVRVAIPVDGRTYYINVTHWEHAKERIAKVDRRMSDTESKIIEINA